MITQIFGDMLYYPESNSIKEFPSPEDLKNRIIISTKPPKEYLESKNGKNKEINSQKREYDPQEDGKGSNREEAKGNDIADRNASDGSHHKVLHCFLKIKLINPMCIFLLGDQHIPK